MKIFVDGDACPVVEEIVACASFYEVEVVFVHSYAHSRRDPFPSFVKEITTDSDKEAVDIAITNQVKRGDVVVTQDLGLSGLLLAKGVIVLHPRGSRVTNQEIDFLLDTRHQQAKRRRAGAKTKGPKKLLKEDREFFRIQLDEIVEQEISH